MNFKQWKDDVNNLFKDEFYVNIEDLGIDEIELKENYNDNILPSEYVQFFSEKYGLISNCN